MHFYQIDLFLRLHINERELSWKEIHTYGLNVSFFRSYNDNEMYTAFCINSVLHQIEAVHTWIKPRKLWRRDLNA